VASDLLAPVRPAFRALALTFVPETAASSEEDWVALEGVVTRALATRPAALQRQVVLFIRILDTLALLRHGRRLASLDPERRSRLLERISRSRLLLFRRGVWGLRTMVMMGWYGRPDVQRALGYRATAAGWAACT
jgi:hypothetical protein